jgi:channel protein (hemolysin III family)
MHAVSFPVWVALGLTMVAVANTPSVGTLLLTIYVVGTGTMFLVSAMYHRGRWQPHTRLLMQKFDRSAIFLAIAGGYTPIAWALETDGSACRARHRHGWARSPASCCTGCPTCPRRCAAPAT